MTLPAEHVCLRCGYVATGAAAFCRRCGLPFGAGVVVLPALEGVDPGLPEEEQLRAAVESNVRWTMRQLLETPEAKERLAEGVMKLVGAVYELATGRVRFLDE